MQFKTFTLLTLAAAAAAGAIPGRAGGGSLEDVAIRDFTEKCKSHVICCDKSASNGDLTGYLNGADVTCKSVPSNVSSGTLEQTRAQCSGGLGCCSADAIKKGVVNSDECSGFVL